MSSGRVEYIAELLPGIVWRAVVVEVPKVGIGRRSS